MIETSDHPWLSSVAELTSGLPGLSLLTARYEVEAFEPGLFARCDLCLPAKLQTANPRRQAEFLAGRALAALVLARIGLPTDVPIGRDRLPQWPKGIRGSISHARGHVACLLGANTGLHPGVDIETRASDQALTALRRHALTNSDRVLLEGRDAEVTAVFSAKESLFKALFPQVGQSFGFDAVELCDLPGKEGIALRLTRDLAGGFARGTCFALKRHSLPERELTWFAVESFSPVG